MIILLIIYTVLGYKSIRYIKANIMHISSELVFNLPLYYGKQILTGLFFGWATIPVMLIHKLVAR